MKPTTKLSLALSLLTLLGIAYAQSARPAAPQATSANIQTPIGNAGRYQIVMSSLARADAFLLDTQTGKVWQWVTVTDLENDPQVWMAQTKLDNTSEFLRWAATQTTKKKQ